MSWEVGARVAGICDVPGATLRRETGAEAQATRGGPGAALSREAGTTPPPPLSARDTWRLRSCPELGGRSQSRRDTWRPRSCPAPGGGYHFTAPSSAPFRGQSGRGAVSIRLPLLLPGRHPTRVAALPSTTTTTTSTSATLALKGYHLHVVLISFYFSHSIHAITTL
jgi:hypothetical protein